MSEKVRELDLLNESLEHSGCDQLNEEVLLCMADNKDWRKCQVQVQAFKQCFEDFQILKLWYYSGKINEDEFYELSRRRRFGGVDGPRTNIQHPFENSAFKFSQDLEEFRKSSKGKTEPATSS